MLLSLLLSGSLLLTPSFALDLSAVRSAWENGDLDDAARLVEEHLAADEGDLEAHLLRAEIQLASNAPESVLDDLDPLAGIGESRVLVLLGRAYEAIGRRLQEGNASNADVDYFLGEAMAYFQEAADLSGTGSVEGATRAGYLALFSFNDWRAALARADASLERAVEDPELLMLRGYAKSYEFLEASRGDDEPTAQAAWDAAVEDLVVSARLLGEASSDAHWQLSWLYEEAARPADAVEAALAHMQVTPAMDISRVYALAKRYSAEGSFAASEAALIALIERDAEELGNWLASEPNPTETAVQLGWSIGPAVQQGRIEVAREVLRPLLSVNPANSDIWNNFGLLCRDTGVAAERSGDTDAADELYATSYAAYEKSLGFDPENPQIMNDTALVMQYHLKTNMARAKQLYRQAIVNAEKLIDDGDERSEIRIALRDARNNLALLEG